MRKRNIIIISSVIVILIIVVGIMAFLNAGNTAEKKALEQEAIINITTGDIILGKIDMALVDEIGIVDFNANLDTSDSDPERHTYTGIILNHAFDKLDIDLADYATIIAKAIDGYNVAYEAEEVLDEDNIYLAIACDGESLGSKSTGGSGPYQIIVTKDTFSQRWCKFVIELELK